MPHSDRPHLTRPLAGVDQALGEGRARPPVELLDQLRERLDRLGQNHPSAGQRSTDRHEVLSQDVLPDQEAAAELAADQAVMPGESAQVGIRDGSWVPKDRADASGDDQAGDEGARESPTVRQAGQPAVAAIDGVAANELGDDSRHRGIETGRVVDTGPAGRDGSYRPWFADDPDTPWFVEPWFVE